MSLLLSHLYACMRIIYMYDPPPNFDTNPRSKKKHKTRRAHQLLLPVPQQDVVVGALADQRLVVVEVLARGPEPQVRVVVLARPRQLPVRSREQRVGSRSAP